MESSNKILDICFNISREEEVGGYIAEAHIPDTKTTLITEGDTFEDLFYNISDVTTAYSIAINTEIAYKHFIY